MRMGDEHALFLLHLVSTGTCSTAGLGLVAGGINRASKHSPLVHSTSPVPVIYAWPSTSELADIVTVLHVTEAHSKRNLHE